MDGEESFSVINSVRTLMIFVTRCKKLQEICAQRKICLRQWKLFLACRLIPLDKNPGFRLIGVGEFLMRIIGKAIMTTFRENIVDSVGSLQISCCSYDEKNLI